jgi:hypothetical protein
MMTMQTALITSRDPKGLQAVRLFEAAYDKFKLDGDRAQRLNENGGEFQEGITELIARLTTSNKFANEQVASSYTYPKEYKGPKPIGDQIKVLAKILNLDPSQALKFVENLPELPTNAEGWFAIPSIAALRAKHFPSVTDSAQKYCNAVEFILAKIEASRRFYNYRRGEITSKKLRVHARTAHALDLIAETQKGDILVIAAQLGMLHRGQSSRRARETFVANEFGLGSVAVGSIVLIHPERLVRWEELDMDLAGDEFSPDGDGEFSRAPCLLFYDGRVGVVTRGVGGALGDCGAASGFLTQ